MRIRGAVAGLLLTAGIVSGGQAAMQGPAPVALPSPASSFRWTGELSQGGLIRGQAPSGAVSATLDGEPLALAPDGPSLPVSTAMPDRRPN